MNKARNRRWKHGGAVDLRDTLTHRAHVLVVVVPAVLALATLDLLVAFIGLIVAELIVFTVLPRLGWVKTAIDEHLEHMARIEAAAARAALLGRMSDAHRCDLAELERIADTIPDVGGVHAPELRVSAALGLERLLSVYVRLAIAHRATSEAFDDCRRAPPDEEMARLLRARTETTGTSREWIDRRLAILKKRSEAWRSACEEQTV